MIAIANQILDKLSESLSTVYQTIRTNYSVPQSLSSRKAFISEHILTKTQFYTKNNASFLNKIAKIKYFDPNTEKLFLEIYNSPELKVEEAIEVSIKNFFNNWKIIQ